jgi:DNA primase
MIPADFIQTLLARVDIVEVVDRHVPLRKAGANYQACCPFHSEKTPSFTVSPTKQFYHCFGCGAHGTAIGFLMEHAGRTFPEAVEELARDAGLAVPHETRQGSGAGAEAAAAAADLPGIMLAAARFYRASLRDAPQAIAYLKGRGMTGAVAARFGIGYAPDAWQPLSAAVDDYASEVLEQVGLVIRGEAGKRYDRFRDRIMFPIHDSRGRVIAFGGRVLGKGEPKYLNSPETALFSKGRELYGLYLARNAIREAGRVVVVEGYMDVVALAQHGIDYAVATLGTSTTPVHAQKLFRLTDSVVFCFDGDAAGRKAAWRALENTLPVLQDGKDARFLFLPDGEDPDDYVRARGREAFEAAVAAAMPASEYLAGELCARHPPTSAEGRSALLAAARPLIGATGAPILKALLRRRFAELAGMSEAETGELLGHGTDHGRGRETESERPRSATPSRSAAFRATRRAPSLARQILAGLLVDPALGREAPLPRQPRADPELEALAAVVECCRSATGELTGAGIVQTFVGTPFEDILSQAQAAALDHGLSGDMAAEQVRAGIDRLWQLAGRAGEPQPDGTHGAPASPEETERLRQLQLVRGALRHAAGSKPDEAAPTLQML